MASALPEERPPAGGGHRRGHRLPAAPGLERAQLSLAESHWVAAYHSLVIVGATGLGKTYVACALANAAIRRGQSALYVRAPRLLDDIAMARADGRVARLLASWARSDVLLIDDVLRPLGPRPTCSR